MKLFSKQNFVLQIIFVAIFRIKATLSGWFYCWSRRSNSMLFPQNHIHVQNPMTTFCQHLPSILLPDRSSGTCGDASYFSKRRQALHCDRSYRLLTLKNDDNQEETVNGDTSNENFQQIRTNQNTLYDLGIGRNKPLGENGDTDIRHGSETRVADYWKAPEPVVKPIVDRSSLDKDNNRLNSNSEDPDSKKLKPLIRPRRIRRMVARDNASQKLRAAMWDESHYDNNNASNKKRTKAELSTGSRPSSGSNTDEAGFDMGLSIPKTPEKLYPDIDLSIPYSVYSDDGSVDLVWDLLRWEAFQNQKAQREPLLVSFMHSTILNHPSLESSLSFLLANRLQSPAMMISTQLQSLIYDALQSDAQFRRNLRADIMAVRDRDPACNTLPDVFLYFKGFHALQSHRVANVLWKSGREVLAQFLQSQVSQIFQIDIHPNATLGSGIMLDHGTGIVIGETATVGSNCSILHHVTLGGSGKKGVVRHPSIGNGVLLGAGATVLGPVTIGCGSQVGAGTLVISNLPAHCVAVGVPARIIGSFIDVTEQPSIGMNQLMDDNAIVTFESDGI